MAYSILTVLFLFTHACVTPYYDERIFLYLQMVIKFKKALSLLLTLVFCFAVASIAFARYEVCSYCGGRVEYRETIRRYIDFDVEDCPNNPGYTDHIEKYQITDVSACRDCNREIGYDVYLL